MSPTTQPQRSRKSQKQSGKEREESERPAVQLPTAFFPFARYTSVVGVHTSLIAFTALFLPRTSLSSLFRSSAANGQLGKPDDVLLTLTENPLRTLAWICAGSCVLQVWWASWLRNWALDARAGVTEGADDTTRRTEQKLLREEWNSGRFAAFRMACLAAVVTSVVFSIVIILYGAPLNSHLLRTYLLGLLVALLSVFSAAYTLGVPSLGSDTESLVRRLTWIRLFAELSPRTPVERAILYPAIGTVLGCWVGAIPIGLDWERPWQAWPLTPAYGAVSGYIVGSLWALAINGVRQLYEIQLRENREAASAKRSEPQHTKKKGT
ncbi:unnamed protein product [Somion occarium]|uniref:Phosphatidylinositol-glycan biosynthesis class F protein n=1 Tax=Somion occarium TaxID=3059160 RepID=A0ABP1DR92_9APHY